MLDVSLFRRPAFVGVQLATFCIGAGMFALFPFLSIYLQDILGNTPLGAGLRFLPITVFVFIVPLATRKLRGARADVAAARDEPRDRLGRRAPDGQHLARLGLDCAPRRDSSSPGSASASRTRRSRGPRFESSTRPAREWPRGSATPRGSRASRWASRCSARFCEHRVGTHLAAAGVHSKELAAGISSSGLRATAGNPALSRLGEAAFVSGLRLVLLIGFLTVLAGSIAAAVLVRRPTPAPDPVLEPAR